MCAQFIDFIFLYLFQSTNQLYVWNVVYVCYFKFAKEVKRM